jgi:hypothetical protein
MEADAPEPRRGPGREPGREPGRDPGRPPDVRDVSGLRISDEERHKVAEVLRLAAGEGRIDIEELDERLEATYNAKTYGELVPITADLPSAFPRPTPAVRGRDGGVPGGARFGTSVAVMSETRRTGPWVLEDGHTAFALMGSVVLDLREAQFQSQDLTINASAVMGEVRLLVDAGTTVVVGGFGLMGDYSEQRAKVPFDPAYGGPVVRVRGIALMGSVHVQRRGRPGEGALRRLGRSGT